MIGRRVPLTSIFVVASQVLNLAIGDNCVHAFETVGSAQFVAANSVAKKKSASNQPSSPGRKTRSRVPNAAPTTPPSPPRLQPAPNTSVGSGGALPVTAEAAVVGDQVNEKTDTPSSLPSATGKNTERPTAFTRSGPRPPFTYVPVDGDYWARVNDLLAKKRAVTVVEEGAARASQRERSTPVGAEGLLAAGIGLRELGYSFGSFWLLQDLAKEQAGTRIGEAALYNIDQIVRIYPIDDFTLETLLSGFDFSRLDPDVQSFVSYHRGHYSRRLGFDNWAKNDFALIAKDTFWDFRQRYFDALQMLANDRLDEALESMVKLREDPKVPAGVKRDLELQSARLLFEKGEFQSAAELYKQLDLTVREKGRVILERAWANYYAKNYSKALGLLAALRAPYFDPSLHHERYVLEMIIFRELCQFDSVEEVAIDFREKFGKSLRAIRERKPLREDRVMANMALLDRRFQSMATFIGQMRIERRKLDESRQLKKVSFFSPLVAAYTRKEAEVQERLDLTLEGQARLIAVDLLDATEQIEFIDYTSKLSALRVDPDSQQEYYQREKVPYTRFDKIYWRVTSEHWSDEFEDYKYLISDKCNVEQELKVTPDEEKFR